MQSSTPPSMGGDNYLGTVDTKVIIPAGSLDAYKSADGWKDIINVIVEKEL